MNKLLKKNKKSGFTLIELMIVVAIIGILAAIAIPNFIRYQLRSKTSEAKVNLGAIKTNLTDFRAAHRNQYPGMIAVVPAMVDVQGNKQSWAPAVCADGCISTMADACISWDCVGWSPEGDVYYIYQGDRIANPTEYGTAATANLDASGDNGIFGWGTANALLQEGMDVGTVQPDGCDVAIPSFEVADCHPGEY